jgi:hypothetical protein
MEVNHKVAEDSSDLPRVPDAQVNRKKNDDPSVSDISDDESSSESSDAPKLPPKPVKPRRSRTSMLASFGYDINDAVKVSSVFTALDEREAAEQERKRQEKEAKKLRREKLRQERERKQMEREEKGQREHEEQNNKSIDDTIDGSLPPTREIRENEQLIKKHTTTVPNGEVRPNVIVLKAEQEGANGELPRKKRKYVRKPKEETETKEGKEKKRRRKDSEETKPRKKRRKDSEENEEKGKEVTKKKRRRKESNGDEEKPKRRRKKNNNNNNATDASERSEEEPKKKRRKKKKEDDVSHDKSDSANSTKKTTRGRKPKRENNKKSEPEHEKSESERATRGSKEEDESGESGEEWTLIEEDLLPGDTLTIFAKQVFNETIKKHAKAAAARALDRGYGFPMVPFQKLKPKYKPRKGLYECINQLAVNEQIAASGPIAKGRKEFRIPYGPDNENGLSSSIEEDDKRLIGSRKIQHPKKRLLSHLRSSSDGSKQSDLAQDEVDNFVKINTAESM